MIVNKYNVDNKLIRGSKPGFKDVYRLKKEGVTQIVCLSTKHDYKERLACKVFGVKFNRQLVSGLDGIYLKLDDYKKITNDINANKGKTYIHCRRGLHRTGECVAAYNILNNKKSFNQAVTEDIFQKNYFEHKYSPSAVIINNGDGIITRIQKKHFDKIRIVLANSFRHFVGVFKP